MINPQKGIDLMNNTSIIIRILFVVTLFQHSPLTRKVFYNNIRRERGHHHQQHQVSERTTLSTACWNIGWHIYKSSEVFLISSIVNHNGMKSSSASIWISIKLIHHHHHSTRLVTSSQHEAGTSSQHEAGTSSQHEVGTSSQHEVGTLHNN
jgi:hypothetical protein